jgi:hypothetical protein
MTRMKTNDAETRTERKERVAAELAAKVAEGLETAEQAAADAAADDAQAVADAATEQAAAATVTVIVPKKYSLRIDYEKVVTVMPGVQTMLRKYADHWYSKANGVQIFTGE